MITVYKKTDLGLDQVDEVAPGTWIHLIDPTRAEVEQLLTVIDIPEDFVIAALDEDERARTDREDGVTLIILRVPYFFGQDEDLPYGLSLIHISLR